MDLSLIVTYILNGADGFTSYIEAVGVINVLAFILF